MPVEQLIYTDAPRGQGVDPGRKGYQLRACSPGVVGALRAQLEHLCEHYYAAVHAGSPAAARDKEQAWRRTAPAAEDMPEEILAVFPTIVAYDRVGDGRYALSVARYVGFAHDKRPGNALVRTAVVGRDDLAPFRSNPVAAALGSSLAARPALEGTALTALADLGRAPASSTPARWPEETPLDRGKLEELVAALAAAPVVGRPVLLCLGDWRQAAPLLTALLELVPPSARAETTFTTLETDRRWMPVSTAGARPNGRVAGHDVVVLCRVDDRPFDLRAEEYRAFAAYNFADGRWSDGASTPYAALAVEAFLAGDGARLEAFHVLLERLGLGADRAAWDALVPAAPLAEGRTAAEVVGAALRALGAAARTAEQAAGALDVAWPSLEGLAAADEAGMLADAGPSLAALVDLEASGGAGRHGEALASLAERALADGRARLALALLAGCGRGRERALARLARAQAARPAAASRSAVGPPEAEALYDLLVAGAKVLVAAGEPGLAPESLALPVFTAAAAAGKEVAAWTSVGDALVRRPLATLQEDAKVRVAELLAEVLTQGACPEGNLWLNLALARSGRLDAARLESALMAASEAVQGLTGADGRASELLEAARGAAGGHPERRAQLCGLLANGARGSALAATFLEAYRKALAEAQAKDGGAKDGVERSVRRWLIDRGAAPLVVDECVVAVVDGPADPTAGDASEAVKRAMRAGDWWSLIKPRATDELRRALSRRFAKGAAAEGRAAAFAQLLLGPDNGPPDGEGAAMLVAALVHGLPLAPLDRGWQETLEACPPPADGPGRARLAALRVLTAIDDRAARGKGPGTAAAMRERLEGLGDDWRGLADLGADDLRGVLRTCARRLVTAGLTDAGDAQALIDFAASARLAPAEGVPELVEALLDGRDRVTRVVVMTAFGVLAMQRPDGPAAEIAAAMLAKCGRGTRELFQEHLHKRFAAGDREYPARSASLCARLGLEWPAVAVAAAVAESKAPAELAPGSREAAASPTAGGGWLKGVKGMFSRRPKDGEL